MTHRDAGRAASPQCWIISDGKAGVETQCFAVAEQLTSNITLKRVPQRPPWSWMAPYGPADPAMRFGDPTSDFGPPWPDIAIAGGRMTVPYMRTLRRHVGRATFCVFLQDPRTGPSTADVIWVPQHDRRRGENVFTTLTTPHRLTLVKLADRRAMMPDWMARCPEPRVAVLVGGNSRNHTFSGADQQRFIDDLDGLSQHAGSFFVTASRRTPPELAAQLERFMDGKAGLLWDGTGDNPLHDFIAHADHVVVTADSANMVSEVCITGRPVHVFHPSGGSKKFDRLYRALEAHGAIRPLQETHERLDTWHYEPLSATETIAEEINRRWMTHRTLHSTGS